MSTKTQMYSELTKKASKELTHSVNETESSLCLLLPKKMPALPISKKSYPDIQIDLKNIKV